MTESQKRAKSKYIQNKVKQVCIPFYPKDHDLLDQAKKQASSDKKSMTAYIKGLIYDDIKRI